MFLARFDACNINNIKRRAWSCTIVEFLFSMEVKLVLVKSSVLQLQNVICNSHATTEKMSIKYTKDELNTAQ